MLRTRVHIRLAFFGLIIATMMLPLTAVAEEDDGMMHGDKYASVDAKRLADFQSTAARNANPDSNAPSSFAPCIRGMAAGTFPCDGIDMLSFVPHGELGTTFANDIWGWTDPQTRRDYALLGAGEGTVFVDITDPRRPDVLGILPTTTSNNFFWRDIKVHADHAFVVSEDSNHGMQVFDLTQLRDWDGTYTTYTATALYTDKGRSHNIAINEDTGYAYLVGGAQDIHGCAAGLHIVDISDPANPTFEACYTDDGYIHDVQCVVYEGPDTRFTGNEICFGSNEDTVSTIDVTDKQDPVRLDVTDYPNVAYSHQGWLTPDQQYFLHSDEADEVVHGVGTTTRVWDVRDLTDLQLVQVFENDTTSIDHNIYTQGRYAYASNYSSGLRVYDTRDVAAGGLREVGYFDMYPEDDDPHFDGGTWSNYPYFRQKGVVAVSSMDRGLFILQPRVGRAGN